MNEVDNLISIIESQMNSGVSRLSLSTSEDVSDGSVNKIYHHGRCDVGSPFATGSISMCDYNESDSD